ncbi:hypothetical protein H4S14_002743 [Agrobacterium vitis]|nr:hypothetical protein [Agrobacterium vitis]MBE1438983.1 hypothetical protein [Agrobacterium vitis]
MVSGKPPRRSKTTEEPVIIDLTATEVAPEKPENTSAEETTSSAQTPDVPTEPQPESEPAIAAETTQAKEPAKEESLATEPEPATEPRPASDTEPATLAPDHPDSEQQEDTRFGSGTSTCSPQTPPPQDNQPASARPSSNSISSLLAAGIAGGLIALIGAGSIQYAGLLPVSGPSGSADTVAALSAEVESLKETMAKGQPAADTSALEARIGQLESSQQNPQATIDPATITDLQTRLASADQAIDQLKSDMAGRVQSLTSGQTQMSDTLSAIQTRLDKPRDDIEVARAIAASALKTAADRGGPFLAELRTLGSIAPEDPAIAALEPYAATGAVSRAELLERFGKTADTILSAINQPADSASIGERLLASAMSVIKVRPVGNVAGDDPSAIVARIEDKIRNGDLRGAAAEWESLPEVGRTVSEGFKKALDGRIAVEAQVSDALARSVAGRQG